jgi:hypothetical protein
MFAAAALRVVLVTTLALGATLSAEASPAVARSLVSIEAAAQSFDTAQRALDAARARHEELAHRITALKRVSTGASATLSTLLEASITAERELAERATARDRAKAEVERRASDSMQLIDAEIVALRPSLKVPEARAEAARRLKSLIADREAARAAVTRLARAEASTPKAWKQYEVKVEALDGPADLREKADFVEDTRDKLRKKRAALERLVADARQSREIARASANFRTELGLFDEQSRTGRVARSTEAGATNVLADNSARETNQAAPETPPVATVNPPGRAAEPEAPPADGLAIPEFGATPAPAPIGQPTTTAPTTVPTPSAAPLPKSVDPTQVLNLDIGTLGAGQDVASLEALLRDLQAIDRFLDARAAQIRRRAEALEADESQALGR